MQDDTNQPSTADTEVSTENDEDGIEIGRRNVLKLVGTTAAATTGIAAFSGSAAALSCGDYLDAWYGYPTLYYGRLNGVRSGMRYRLMNVNSYKALDVEGWSTDNGGNIHQWEWADGDNQVWRIDYVGDGAFRFVSQHSGKVMDVEAASYDSGANIHQWDWVGGDNQKWYIDLVPGNGEHAFWAVHSDKVVDVDGGFTSNGANVQQWDWHGGDNQRWYPQFAHNGGTLFIFTHGWLEEIGGDAQDQAYTAEVSLEDNGYWGPVIANEYASNNLNWWDAKDEAKRAGRIFGDALYRIRALNPYLTVRVMGHSLGAMMTLSALNQLADRGGWIHSLDLVGGAVDHDSIGEDWAYGIQNAVGQVYNYHSYDDDILDVIYEIGEWDEAVGYAGAEGWTPSNYTDYDVTDDVSSHCEYFKRWGCMHHVVANW